MDNLTLNMPKFFQSIGARSMNKLIGISFAVMLAFQPVLAMAADGDQCWTTPDDGNRTSYFNPQVTDNWRVSVQSMDWQVMSAMAGVYYGDIWSSRGDQVSHEWMSFSANGIFDYRSQTCGNMPGLACSPNQGTGSWTAHRQQDGSIYVMANFSDSVRANQCFSQTIMLQGDGYQAQGGIFWQRVQP